MQIQTSLIFHLILARMAKINKTMTAHADKDVGKENTHPLLVGVQTCIATMEISVVVPQEDANQATSRSS